MKGTFIVSLTKIITKFKETGSRTIRAGRGRKPVSEEVITDVAPAFVKGSQETISGSRRAWSVARQLNMNYSTVWRVLRRVIRFHSYKISRLHKHLLGWRLMIVSHGTFCGKINAIFI